MAQNTIEFFPHQNFNDEENLGDNHFSLTQDNYNDIDVVWDWNSPQAKRKPQAQPRYARTTPKAPLKRHNSNSQVQSFERLKESIQVFKKELAQTLPPVVTENVNSDETDIFDDSIDEQLELLSQHLSEINEIPGVVTLGKDGTTITPLNIPQLPINPTIPTRDFSTGTQGQKTDKVKTIGSNLNLPKNSTLPTHDNPTDRAEMQRTVKVKTIGSNLNLSKNSITRTKSEDPCSISRVPEKSVFQRTRSFESAASSIPKQKMAEIEKKRLDAIARLEAKRKVSKPEVVKKCSPNEIEKKRLLALAKLEAKRKEDLIEKKHKEALERLKQNKKKYPSGVVNAKR